MEEDWNGGTILTVGGNNSFKITLRIN